MSQYRKFHRSSTVILIIGLAISVWTFISVMNHMDAKQGIEDRPNSGGGYEITGYDVVLNVDENKCTQVDEHITTEFTTFGKHGIIRFIPNWLEYTAKDREVVSRKATISNLICNNEQYSVDTVKGKKRIKIGNPNRTLDQGTHEYYISYTYDMGTDPYDGFDEYIFHAYGDFWDTGIHNGTITIKFAKDIPEGSKVHFYNEKRRNQEFTKEVDYKIEGNTLTARMPSYYSFHHAVTVDVELPEGFFSKGSNPYGFICIIICFICLGLGVLFFCLWMLYGRNFRKAPLEYSFTPPAGLDVAEIGYIYKKDIGRKLTVALICALASKGYISIKDDADGKIKVKREKPSDNNLSANELLVYKQLFSSGSSTDLSTNKHFYEVFLKVNESVTSTIEDKIYDLYSTKLRLYSSISFAVSALLLKLAYCNIEDMNPKYVYLYLIAALGVFINLISTLNIERKTQYGQDITNQIKGFKCYLEQANENQISASSEANPDYITDMVPYAYILGVSKVWIDKCNIPKTPEYDYVYSPDYYYSNIYTPAPSSSSSSSSGGCSSCGGGCSSCGGGCSSCGGGSSW